MARWPPSRPTNGVLATRAWVLGNWSRFVRPGFVRVSVTAAPQNNIYLTAFTKADDGRVVVVAVNQGYVATEAGLHDRGRHDRGAGAVGDVGQPEARGAAGDSGRRGRRLGRVARALGHLVRRHVHALILIPSPVFGRGPG